MLRLELPLGEETLELEGLQFATRIRHDNRSSTPQRCSMRISALGFAILLVGPWASTPESASRNRKKRDRLNRRDRAEFACSGGGAEWV